MSGFLTVVTTAEVFSDLEDWCAEHGLSAKVNKILAETIGVLSVNDLTEVVTEIGMMNTIRENCTMLEFKKFMGALKNTPILSGILIAVPGEAGSQKAMKAVSVSDATYSHSTPANQALKEQIERQERFLAEQEEKEKLEKRFKKLLDSSTKLTIQQSNSKTKADIEKKMRTHENRSKMVKELFRDLKEIASLDIAFLTDCTGSMCRYIDNVKTKIREMVHSAKEMYPDLCVRVAFVGYRDHSDGPRRIVVHPFSTEIPLFLKFMKGQVASGGSSGWGEDVFGGMEAAGALEWQAETRVLLHIGDMCCHGTEWHDKTNDLYPDGDPAGLSAEKLLRTLLEKKVTYYFGRITANTDIMVQKFNQIVQSYVQTVDVEDARSMMGTLTRSVSRSISATFSSTGSTIPKIDSSHIELDPSMPSWATIRAECISRFELQLPTSIADLKDSEDNDCVKKRPVVCDVKVGLKPFAKGGCRAAYKAKDLSGSRLSRDTVHKVSLSGKSSDLSRQRYESILSNQCVAIFLAKEFNKVKPADCPSIRFVDAWLLQYLDRKDTPYGTMEDTLQGIWEKFNNNEGFVQMNPSLAGVDHAAVQTFSHWSHVATERYMMVLDCQGCFDSKNRTFSLTDPAIQCRDMSRFGGTNMGREGFESFYNIHKCNAYCHALKL